MTETGYAPQRLEFKVAASTRNSSQTAIEEILGKRWIYDANFRADLEDRVWRDTFRQVTGYIDWCEPFIYNQLTARERFGRTMLMRMNREKLVALARSFGLPSDLNEKGEPLNKRAISSFILEVTSR